MAGLVAAFAILCAAGPVLAGEETVTVLRGSSAPVVRESAPPDPPPTTVVREIVYVPQYYPMYYVALPFIVQRHHMPAVTTSFPLGGIATMRR